METFIQLYKISPDKSFRMSLCGEWISILRSGCSLLEVGGKDPWLHRPNKAMQHKRLAKNSNYIMRSLIY